MRLRFVLAYALLLVAAAPLFDHHTTERDPFHSHLSQAVQAAHRHGVSQQHSHLSHETDNAGVVAVRASSGLPAPAPAMAAISACAPCENSLATGGPFQTVQLRVTPIPTGPYLLLAEPPPRLPL